MSLYSAIQFTSVSFLYASASNLGDFQVCSIEATDVYRFDNDSDVSIVSLHRPLPDIADCYI